MLPNFWVPVVILGGVLYLLYRKGLAVTKSIAAVLFAFYPGRERDRARLNSCTGWVRHVGRFHRNRTYEFTLDCQLSKGSAAVCLLDRKKQPLLNLDSRSPSGRLSLGEKTYLRWDFQNATGQCELSWKEI